MRCSVIDKSLEHDCRAVVESLCTGHKAKEIIVWFKHPKTMVKDVGKAYVASGVEDNFKPEGKTHEKSSDATTTPEFVVAVFGENPSKNMRKIAE